MTAASHSVPADACLLDIAAELELDHCNQILFLRRSHADASRHMHAHLLGVGNLSTTSIVARH